jgi:hypothetical protein
MFRLRTHAITLRAVLERSPALLLTGLLPCGAGSPTDKLRVVVGFA